MPIKTEKLEKNVAFETLENALISAAKKMGWKVNVRYEYQKKSYLGVPEKVMKLHKTEFKMRKSFLPKIKIDVYNKDMVDKFDVKFGVKFETYIRKKKAKEYVTTVLDYLATA